MVVRETVGGRGHANEGAGFRPLAPLPTVGGALLGMVAGTRLGEGHHALDMATTARAHNPAAHTQAGAKHLIYNIKKTQTKQIQLLNN